MTTYVPTPEEILELKVEQQKRYDDRMQAMKILWTAELNNDGRLLRKPWEDDATAPPIKNPYDPYDLEVERWFHLDSMFGPRTNILEDISKYVAKILTEPERKSILDRLEELRWEDCDYHFPGVREV